MFRFAPVVLLVAGATLAAAPQANDNAFPHTKPNGRATVEYKDEKVQAVAIYDYSQRNHDGAWLLVQIGVALRERGAVKRDSFSVVMPGGRNVPLATQEQFLADSPQITKLRQNARIFQRDVISYFPKSADGEFIRWFALPGEGTVRDPAIVPSEHGVVIGELFFKSPTLRWDDGTYRLVFDNDKGHAELPIRLE
ncbi:MAG TPA: hypothetical protein VFD69_02825 [Vicinamibacterales bacterium]|nr:hypothetical protein [Vicinamibacterales bacterium]